MARPSSTVRVPDRVVTATPSVRLGREIVFSLSGVVAVSTSPRYYVVENVSNFLTILVSLRVAGTTTTTVTLTRSTAGSPFVTISLTSGQTLIKVLNTAVTAMATDTDYLVAAVTVAGSGARDLDIQVRAQAA